MVTEVTSPKTRGRKAKDAANGAPAGPGSGNIQHSSASSNWYSPPLYVSTARRCMGRIGYDPATCKEAQQIVQADAYDTETGLVRAWQSDLWINPPSPPQPWWDRLIEHFASGDVKKATYFAFSFEQLQQSISWAYPMLAFPCLIPSKRINFWSTAADAATRLARTIAKPDRKNMTPARVEREAAELAALQARSPADLVESDAPGHASALVFLGQDVGLVREHWGSFGEIIQRVPGAR